MPNSPSDLQLCSAKADSYRNQYKDKAPGLLGESPDLEACGIKLDISRQRISLAQLSEMQQCAKESRVQEQQKAMMEGATVNPSEGRAALHTLLRDPYSDLEARKEVQQTLRHMRKFSEAIREKKVAGSRGLPFTDVINIGIGGSYAGPHLVCEACREPAKQDIKIHWISNADGWVINDLLPSLDPATTLVIVSSKSFGTAETMLNADTIKKWFRKNGIEDLANHFVLCTTNLEAPQKIKIPKAFVFKFWDWVGGRFSVWGSVGLPAMIEIGPERFDDFLSGAHDMDLHASRAPNEKNHPITLALLEIWNSTAIGTTSSCCVPYEHRLGFFVGWLQQLEMESLGKSRLIDGTLTKYPTCTPVWGGPGNDAQHAFYQCLRQGTNRTAIDMIVADNSPNSAEGHHEVLLANAKAQADALVQDDPDSEATNCLSVIHVPDLTPYHVGALMALYEHKTSMLGFLLGLNPFDQPGVELGKKLAKKIWEETKKTSA